MIKFTSATTENRLQTIPSKSWFPILRLYGPFEPGFDRPGDLARATPPESATHRSTPGSPTLNASDTEHAVAHWILRDPTSPESHHRRSFP